MKYFPASFFKQTLHLIVIAILCLSGCISFAQAPTINSFSPVSGPVGTLVTIAGANLGSATAFTIGGAAAVPVSNNGTTLVGMVMTGAVTGKVSISTNGGTDTGSFNFTVTATPFPSVQQGSKLVGTGAINGPPQQGFAVSISADGNTAIVGGPNDSNATGAAWIYTRAGATWKQQGNKLVGTGGVGYTNQGYAVALSADGNTAIVGEPGYNNGHGAALIYTRSDTTWTQQGTLIGSGALGPKNVSQGNAVALSADGNTALVGGWEDSDYTGAVWVFTRTDTTWTQQGNKLVGTGCVKDSDGTGQGNSIGLSADGNTAVIGGIADNNYTGAVWVFTRSGTTWTQQGNKLIGDVVTGHAFQGQHVSISKDGNTIIEGGYNYDTDTGGIWIYTRTDTTWVQQGNPIFSIQILTKAVQFETLSVSISADGNTALVGGYYPYDSIVARTLIFTRSGSTWTQQPNKLEASGIIGYAQFGISSSLSADGTTAILGGNGDSSNTGAAWIFIAVPVAPQGSLSANGPFCASGRGQLTWTAPVGVGPFTIVYNDGKANDTITNVESGLPFNVFSEPVTANTTYTLVSVTGSDGLVRDSAFTVGSATIVVNPLVMDSVSISITAGNPDTCVAMPFTFTAVPVNGGATPLYQWFKDGLHVGQNIYSYLDSIPKNGDSIWVVMTSDTLCPASDSVNSNMIILTVRKPVTDTITTSICQGSNYYGHSTPGTFIDTFTSAEGCDSIRLLNLTVNKMAITINKQRICLGDSFEGHTVPGNYTDTLQTIAGCDSLVTLELQVDTLPSSISISQTSDTLTTIKGFTVYNWYVDSTLLTSNNSNTYIISHSGDYSVQISNGDSNCTVESRIFTAYATDIEHVIDTPALSVYPNPASGVINISLVGLQATGPLNIKMYNAVGQKVLDISQSITNKNYYTQLNLAAFSNGVYLLQIQQGDWEIVRRVVRE